VSGLGLSFKIFVLAGLFAAWRQRRASLPSPSLHVFLVVALVASLTPILTQRDMWPFSAWPLVAGRAPSTVRHARLVGVDGLGREHEIDYRAWHPLAFDELMAWIDGPFTRLPAPDRDVAFRYLLEKAEGGRRRGRAGGFGEPALLGRLRAPFFILHPRRWSVPESVPKTPFVTLRLHHESWSPEARARGAEILRVLAFEGPARSMTQ
jgi:hypothetical protein